MRASSLVNFSLTLIVCNIVFFVVGGLCDSRLDSQTEFTLITIYILIKQ